MTTSSKKRATRAPAPELVDIETRARIDALSDAHAIAHLVVELAGRVAVLEARLDALDTESRDD